MANARAQAWFNKLIPLYEAKLPSALHGKVPRPVLLVQGSPAFTAYSAGTERCLNGISLVVDGSSTKMESGVSLLEHHRMFQKKWGCPLEFSPDTGVIKTTAQCAQIEAGYYPMVTLPGTWGVIVISTGLFALPTELSLVGALAHELAHYYNGHHAQDGSSRYGFFYQVPKDGNLPERPVASNDSNLQRLATVIKARTGIAADMQEDLTVYSGYPLHPLVFELVTQNAGISGEIREKCTTGGCPASCAPIVANTAWRELEYQPFSSYSAAQKEAVKPFSNALVQCMNDVGWGGAPLSLSKETLYPSLVQGFSAAMHRFLDERRAEIRFEKPGEMLLSLSGIMNAVVAESNRAIGRAAELRLGYYTVEQEADETALELLAAVGLDPKNYPIDFMAINELYEKLESRRMRGEQMTVRGRVSSETCAKFLKNGFKTESGQYQYIPVADYIDIHHTSCFRAFNAFRDVAAHKYSGNFAPLNDAEYQAFRKELSNLGLVSPAGIEVAEPYRHGNGLSLRAW
jgi:hypothetical protein